MAKARVPRRQQLRRGLLMEDGECILCGTCVDGCPHSALRFSFSAGK